MVAQPAVPERAEAPARQTFVSTTEAGRIAGVHGRTIRRYVADGLITGYKVGPKLIKVDVDEVLRVLVRPIHAAGA